MKKEQAWHENDSFWNEMGEWIFDDGRWRLAYQEVEEILRLINLPDGADILDVGCGPGRHSIDFARRGFSVTGIDRTESYIEKARENAKREQLEIEYLIRDMREFRRPDSFDLALNLFTAIGYFSDEDERRVLTNIYLSLKKGGHLVIDLMGKEVVTRIFQARDWVERDGKFFLEERIPDPDWSHLTSRWIIIDGERTVEHKVRLRTYSAYELTSLLKDIGFSETACYGHLDGAPYDEKAKRLVVVAKK